MHRIPTSPALTNGSKAHHTPVLLGHGMGSNDEQWLVPEKNLGESDPPLHLRVSSTQNTVSSRLGSKMLEKNICCLLHILAAFSFADNGFDVWLGNFRGSFYGQRHATLSVKSRAFWNFRFVPSRDSCQGTPN